jgi:hypothetical protein
VADIGNLIVAQLIAKITLDCQTAYDPPDPLPDDWVADPGRVNLVNRGAFQDDPEDFRTIVCVHRNDPKRTENVGQTGWADEQIVQEMGLIGSADGYGLSEHWYRRFTIEVIVWPGLTQAASDALYGTVMARVRRSVSTLHLSNLVDSHGERIVVGTSPVRRMKSDEGGGPDDEYSWKGFLYLEYQTNWNPN